MKLSTFALIALFSFSTFTFAQENEEPQAFTPNGHPLMKVFTNFHSDFTEDGNRSAFELNRAYFGYEFSLTPVFSTKITLDVGNPGGDDKLHYTMYLKKALLQYSRNDLKVEMGMVGLNQFSVQEKFWSRRYLYKSFQDAYGFGSSADLGLTVSYKINNTIKVDGTLVNGEGYKNLQNDSTFKSSVGITLTPANGLVLRGYLDYLPGDANQSTLASFIGYSAEKYTIGIEYNLQNNHKRINNLELNGISAYGSVSLGNKTELFARFDQVSSNTLSGMSDNWNQANDGQLYIAGIQFLPVNGVAIAPNFQGWSPADDAQSFIPSAYLNLEFKF